MGGDVTQLVFIELLIVCWIASIGKYFMHIQGGNMFNNVLKLYRNERVMAQADQGCLIASGKVQTVE